MARQVREEEKPKKKRQESVRESGEENRKTRYQRKEADMQSDAPFVNPNTETYAFYFKLPCTAAQEIHNAAGLWRNEPLWVLILKN